MDSKKIAALLTSVEKGSLTAAASDLGYTQSGLTHMMNALEDQDIAAINQIQKDNKDLLDKMNRGGKVIDWGTKIGG